MKEMVYYFIDLILFKIFVYQKTEKPTWQGIIQFIDAFRFLNFIALISLRNTYVIFKDKNRIDKVE